MGDAMDGTTEGARLAGASIEPTAESIQPFLAGPMDEPIAMLNLVAFDGDEGRARYAEYGRQAQPFVDAVGGEIVYAGDGLPALVDDRGRSWDAVLLVRYPSRTAFLEMVMNPEYQEVAKLRAAALVDAVLQPIAEWSNGMPAG